MKSLFRIIFITALIAGVSSCSSREAWDFVTLGDSFLARSSIPEQYAVFIEEDMGVEVILHKKAVNGQEPDKLLENLRKDEELHLLIREAEVVVFDFSPGWSNSAELKYLTGTCKGEDNQDCLREALETAKADWTEMADLLTELTTGKPMIIHTFTFGDWIYDGFYKGRITAEQKEVMYGYLVEFQEFQHDDAFARGMYAHPVFPPYVSAPPPAEYLQPDGLHLSDEGSLVISSMVRAVRYQRTPLTSPPPTPTPLATPSISLDAIAGTYTSTLTEEALKQVGAPISTLPFLTGTFKMEFTTDGIVRMWKENAVGFSHWLEGTYTLSADTLTFGLDLGREACSRGDFGSGSYNWSLENGQLTLTLIADECGRKYVMTALPWTRVP